MEELTQEGVTVKIAGDKWWWRYPYHIPMKPGYDGYRPGTTYGDSFEYKGEKIESLMERAQKSATRVREQLTKYAIQKY